jgi:HEAT repeat protein
VREFQRVLEENSDDTPEAAEQRRIRLVQAAEKVKSVGDLGIILNLQGWRDLGLAENVAKADQEARRTVADRLRRDLAALLTHSDPQVRLAAIQATAEMAAEDRRATTRGIQTTETLSGQGLVAQTLGALAPDVARMTKDPDERIRVEAGRALGVIQADPKQVVPALKDLLTSGSAEQRRGAAETLVTMVNLAARPEGRGTDVVQNTVRVGVPILPVAAAGLSDSDASVRRQCAEAVAATTSALVGSLTDVRDVPVDRANPTPAGRPAGAGEPAAPPRRRGDRSPQAIAPLVAAFRDNAGPLAKAATDPSLQVRLTALRYLVDLGLLNQRLGNARDQSESLPPPRSGPEQPSAGKTKETAEGSAQPSDSGPFAEVLRASLAPMRTNLRDPDFRVRLAAVEVLEVMGEEADSAAADLARVLDDSNVFVRWAATRTLGKLGAGHADIALAGLTRLVDDPDLNVRQAVFTALGRYGQTARSAVPSVARAVGRGDSESRESAIRTLDIIHSDLPVTIGALAGGLSDRDPKIRRAAAEVLKDFGADARPALPALALALADSDGEVRRNASDAYLFISQAGK